MNYTVQIKFLWCIPVKRYTISTCTPRVFAQAILCEMGLKGWLYSVHIEPKRMRDNRRSWQAD